MISVVNYAGQSIVVSVSRWDEWAITGTDVIKSGDRENWDRSDTRGYIVRIAWARDDILLSYPFFAWRHSEITVYDGSVSRAERSADGSISSRPRQIRPISGYS